jgi:hypothetical protein
VVRAKTANCKQLKSDDNVGAREGAVAYVATGSSKSPALRLISKIRDSQPQNVAYTDFCPQEIVLLM